MTAVLIRLTLVSKCSILTKPYSVVFKSFNNLFTSMASNCVKNAEGTKRELEENADAESNKKLRSSVEQISAADRVKRKKVALLMSYSGQGYYGMQRNPGLQTIEEDLLTALLKTGFIPQESFNQVQQMQFQRAARTDKGVSAVRQVVSLKLSETANVEEINEHLPEQIRVFSIKRATKGFNSKSNCDARTYSYVLPTYSFSLSQGEAPEESFRISSDTIQTINDILKLYEGTHNFYNFTAKKRYEDPSAARFIIKFQCLEPFVRKGVEFVVLQVKGQSFMLHQIRKMVGLTIAIVKGLTPADTITKAYSKERLDIPVAPGLGLMLEEVHYDRYNQKFGKDGLHENLSWTDVASQVEKFKENYIYPSIIDTEITEKSMFNWLVFLPLHTYDVRDQTRLPQPKGEEEDSSCQTDIKNEKSCSN